MRTIEMLAHASACLVEPASVHSRAVAMLLMEMAALRLSKEPEVVDIAIGLLEAEQARRAGAKS